MSLKKSHCTGGIRGIKNNIVSRHYSFARGGGVSGDENMYNHQVQSSGTIIRYNHQVQS